MEKEGGNPALREKIKSSLSEKRRELHLLLSLWEGPLAIEKKRGDGFSSAT